MCIPKIFFNFGPPKTALSPSEKCLDTGNEQMIKKQLMTSCDVCLFAQPSLRLWSLLCILRNLKANYLNVTKLNRSKDDFRSCRQRQSFVFGAILKIILHCLTVLQFVLRLTCQLGHAIGRTLLKANLRS